MIPPKNVDVITPEAILITKSPNKLARESRVHINIMANANVKINAIAFPIIFFMFFKY